MKQPEESEIPPQAGKQSEAGSEQRDSISPSDLAAIIATATNYARRGWSVIPVGIDKAPTCAWKSAQRLAAKHEDIGKWFGRQKKVVAGVGIVLGEVSGDLYVRDFDEGVAYERWAAAHPELAQSMPTVKTARGFHVYGRWNGVRTASFDCGELRGEGVYVCAPPSQHASGAVYEWAVPLLDSEVPEVDPKAAGLARAWGEKSLTCATESIESTERQRDGVNRETRDYGRNRETENTEEIVEVGFIDNETLARVEDAIKRTLPPMHGKRHLHLFRFARALKGIPAFKTIQRKGIATIRPYVREWHRRALPNILTKDFGTTWGEFGKSWEQVKYPEGDDALAKAIERAEQSDPPDWSKDYSPKHRFLASLCRELQRGAGDKPFFLSNELAGVLLGVDKGTANRWFHAFINDDVLVIVEAPTNGRATRYRYVASDL